MRYSVYVVTAAKFVGELYASLLAGHQLGEAVTRGRLHLFEEPNREVALRPTPLQDWIVPVVYENVDVAVLPTPTDRVPEIKVDGAATEPAQHFSSLMVLTVGTSDLIVSEHTYLPAAWSR